MIGIDTYIWLALIAWSKAATPEGRRRRMKKSGCCLQFECIGHTWSEKLGVCIMEAEIWSPDVTHSVIASVNQFLKCWRKKKLNELLKWRVKVGTWQVSNAWSRNSTNFYSTSPWDIVLHWIISVARFCKNAEDHTASDPHNSALPTSWLPCCRVWEAASDHDWYRTAAGTGCSLYCCSDLWIWLNMKEAFS